MRTIKRAIESIGLREELLTMLARAGSGHTGGSLSVIDLLHVLYKEILTHNPKKPSLPTRDRFVLSAGHLAPALYTVLANQGYFPKKELASLRKLGSRLQGHPERQKLPGIENTSGPLGQGYANAVGKALAAKQQRKKHNIYCLASDGEHDEGVVWEAAQLAAHHHLGNLCVIIDRNNIQIDGITKNILNLKKLKQKYQAFGWKTIEIDGHNHQLIKDALTYFTYQHKEKPLCIIAHTHLGKGVSFMENNPAWHGRTPNKEELDMALQELEKKRHTKNIKQKLQEKKVLL